MIHSGHAIPCIACWSMIDKSSSMIDRSAELLSQYFARLQFKFMGSSFHWLLLHQTSRYKPGGRLATTEMAMKRKGSPVPDEWSSHVF